ncbi:MAG: VWA domain-containing protein [Planctomycetota bacterium]
MIVLRNPWLLFALLLLPVIWWAWLNARRRAAISFAGVARLGASRRSWSLRARHVIPALRSLAVALLVLAIARPQEADEETRVSTEGIAIQLAVDRSGSMEQPDLSDAHGEQQRRIDAVKDVVQAFVEGDDDALRGRPDDLIGLIAFGTYADTECPLTRDHGHLLRALEKIEPYNSKEEGMTAIGDALLLATERIRNIGRRFAKQASFRIKSRIIILLTDGEQTAGKFTPEEAAEVAAALGVKVYTIGAAPDYEVLNAGTFFARRAPTRIDEEGLKKVADMTGGKYFRARDADSLRSIYAEIDQLERSVIDETRLYHYEELAYRWFDWQWDFAGLKLGPVRLPPLLMVVLVLLTLEVILANTRFRRIP